MRLMVSMLILCSFLNSAYAKSARQFQREIDKESKNLQQLKKSIDEKKAEKEKFALEEKAIKKELQRIEQELQKLQKQREVLRRNLLKAEKSLEQSECEMRAANLEKGQWQKILKNESKMWVMYHHSYSKLFQDDVLEVQRLKAMKQKKCYIDNARAKEENSKASVTKWENARKRMFELKAQQEAMAQEREKVKGQKQELLKTTIGRRIVAEYEMKKLGESAKALENVIFDLEKKRKKTEQEKQAKKKFEEKRKQLPWPVEGTVIQKFGKNKHPEFDTYIISNGIKIKAKQHAEVKAVNKGDVIFSGEFRAYGLMVIVDHGGGFYSIYGQLGEVFVEEGQKIKSDAVIGRAGAGIDSSIYFEIRSSGKPDDPLLWLK